MQNRLVGDWLTSVTTADAEIRKDMKLVRDRSRDLERTCPWVRRYLDLARNNVLGANGIGMQMKVRELVKKGGKWVEQYDDRANRLIEDAWWRWGQPKFCTTSKQLSWVDAQDLALRSAIRDVSMLCKFEYPADGNPFHFSLQLMEGDHLDTDYNAALPNGHVVRLGVEYDAAGAKYGYHLLKNHPGDLYQQRNTYGPHREFVSADQMIHLYRPERIGQSDGMSRLASTMISLKMLSGYAEAEVIAARIAASKMGFLEPDANASGGGYQGEGDGKGGKYMEVEPGNIEQLPYGYKFKEFDPSHPTTNYPEFVKAKLREIASGLGVSYNSLANDLEGVNYSSIRAGLLEEREEWKALQGWFIGWFVQPVFEAWLKSALDMGAITDGVLTLPPSKFDKFNSPEWKPRRWAWVDPLKDMQANVLAVEKGFTSRRQVIAEGGGDIEEVFNELQADEQLAEDKGLEFTKDYQAANAVSATGKGGDDAEAALTAKEK